MTKLYQTYNLVGVVVSLLIQVKPSAQNVFRPLKEPQRRYKSELRPTKHKSPHPHYWGAAHATVPGSWTVRILLSCLLETWRSWVREDHAGPTQPAEGQPVEPVAGRTGRTIDKDSTDQTTDVARQQNIGRSQGDENSWGLNPAPGEYTRWDVLSLVRYFFSGIRAKVWGGMLIGGLCEGASLWMHREPSGIAGTSLRVSRWRRPCWCWTETA